ncbi:acyltransferase family protein [Cellvibrio polysaccharolyticus]|uniref:Acyltransferase n=1 Tax=Cellvibrio polysaccharolyticus TaxID=2082724 RepID=A0A928UZE5_9GAMM|nr:acyltransferase [Cellvibrio polysaccharolyticus]MBE8716035.1 acyltransferase [Cellvibrio polysaccharolyticus]
MRKSEIGKNRFNILDPLRFFAAMSVLVYHYSIFLKHSGAEWLLHTLSFGYLGVNFFFLLSGFVIIASAQNRNAIDFAVSRVIRLYPAFWICLLITVAAIYFIEEKKISIFDVLANASILNDYLGVKNIDGVFWTLQAEIKFYGCIFLLILTGLIRFIRTWLLVWLLLSILYHFYEQPFFLSWFISPGYSFYFIGGVCCYQLYKRRDPLILSILVISMIFSIIKSSSQIYDFFPGAGGLDEMIAAAIISIFFLTFYLLSMGLLNFQPRRYFLLLGAISYPLYLIHNRAGKIVIEEFLQIMSPVCSVLLVSVIVIAASFLVHIIFEKPMSATMKKFCFSLIKKFRLTS